MSDLVVTRAEGDIAVMSLYGPVQNAVTHAMRSALGAALEDAINNSAIRAIVLKGQGPAFSSGSDYSELDDTPDAPSLRDLCALIEDAPKPVVCALHGMAIGAGFELALAAHARVAQRGTRLAIPDIHLALIPCGGATQRLPRVLGAKQTLQFLMNGKSAHAEDAALQRLFHDVTEETPLHGATALARSFADKQSWPRTREDRRGFSDPRGYATSIATLRAQLPDHSGAAQDLLRAVEAAQLFPFEQGMALEAALFEERLASPESRAARHALRCERRAAALPEDTVPEPIEHIFIIGATPLSCQIAAALLETKAEIRLMAGSDTAVASAREMITQQVGAHLPGDQAATRLSRLQLQAGQAGLAQADLVLDGGEQALDLPTDLKAGVIWARLDARAAASRTADLVAPGRALPLWLHRPVGRGGLAEIACDEKTDQQALATLKALFAGIDLLTIQTAAQAGALGQRMGASLQSAACLLIAHGADPYKVDEAALSLGFKRGPLQLMDEIGLQAIIAPLAQFAQARALVDVSQGLLQALCDKGRTGKAAGRGFYLYSHKGPTPDPALQNLARDLRLSEAAAGLTDGALADALLGALVNEAARLLGEGAAQRASDLDLLALRVMAFGRKSGGPLLQADMRGIFHVYKALRDLAALSQLWAPDARVTSMANNAQGFFGRSKPSG